ncbi:hypothetical protein DXG01_015747, partial [Tephrocybe rancida]
QGSEYEGNLGLNLFYGRMLKWLIAGDEEKSRQFRKILGTLTHLYAPITVHQFEGLVDIPEQDLQHRLLELQPIIIVSSDKRLMRPIHESVGHWLTDQDRALPTLFVEAAEMHLSILLRLIECMNSGLDRNSRIHRLQVAIGDSHATIGRHCGSVGLCMSPLGRSPGKSLYYAYRADSGRRFFGIKARRLD